MKKNIISINIYSILLIFLFQGCHKTPQSTEYIPTQLKEYGIFQKGSYWIFKNENTNDIDSIFIEKSPSFTYLQDGDGPIMEKCEIYYGGPLITSSYLLWSEYGTTMRSGVSNYCLVSASFQPGYTYGIPECYFQNIKYFDSLKINNNTFNSVMVTSCRTITVDRDTTIYTYFISRSIGFVKINFYNNNQETTWSILRYNVIQ